MRILTLFSVFVFVDIDLKKLYSLCYNGSITDKIQAASTQQSRFFRVPFSRFPCSPIFSALVFSVPFFPVTFLQVSVFNMTKSSFLGIFFLLTWKTWKIQENLLLDTLLKRFYCNSKHARTSKEAKDPNLRKF